jgi:glutathione S-transferase
MAVAPSTECHEPGHGAVRSSNHPHLSLRAQGPYGGGRGLNDRVTIEPADTTSAQDSLRQQNPIGKIPCLVRADGRGIHDSSVILEFLQEVVQSHKLLPAAGMERIDQLVSTRLADGIIDAGAVIIYEERYHPSGQRSDHWLSYQREKIERALARFEQTVPDPHVTDAVTIGLACALGFLDKRTPVVWRESHPRLVAWLERFTQSEPAFLRTSPP